MAQIRISGLAEVYRRAQLYRVLGPRRPRTPARRVEAKIEGDARKPNDRKEP